jgi:hypothetical protein
MTNILDFASGMVAALTAAIVVAIGHLLIWESKLFVRFIPQASHDLEPTIVDRRANPGVRGYFCRWDALVGSLESLFVH